MISIFCKRAFLNVSPGEIFALRTKPVRRGHLMRVSSIIRGDQIAEYLNAKLNPTEGYENDVCVYVKPHVPPGFDFNFEGHPYMDIVDGWGLIPLMEKHPEVPVIACSEQDVIKLSQRLKNKMILIPQHHCNYNREKRERTGIKTIGIIGTYKAFNFLPPNIDEELKKRGIELIRYSNFFSRQDIIDFYKGIDLQLIWRPYRMRLSNSLKLVNAASFGIPSIVFEETVFEEIRGCYLQGRTLETLMKQLDHLIADPHLYDVVSQKSIELSEKYHISNIAKLYQQLT